ncbi:MAG: class I SAM-dependent methyltransferase [Phycisphaeraceae bacterium JB051]
MSSQVKAFYDVFSERFIRDFVFGNLRVQRQVEYFSQAIPADTKRILVIGCGSGESALHLVEHVAPQANILAVDLASNSVEIAQKLFPHPQIQYQQMDVVTDTIDGSWDVIVMPDVLEHIPLDGRDVLFEKINTLLSDRGILLITCPAPNARRSRRRAENTLSQIVDEDVSLEDLMHAGKITNCRLSFYRLASIWHPNDYFHAMLEREPDTEAELSTSTATPIKCCPQVSPLRIKLGRLARRMRLHRFGEKWRERFVRKRMKQ